MQSIIKYLVIYLVTATRYLILAGGVFFICYRLLTNKISKSKIQARKASSKDFLREIFHSLKASIVLAFMGYLVLFTPLKTNTLIYKNVLDYPLWWLPLSLVVALIIHDTYFYWMHRLLHNKLLFPKAHIIHHKSTNPSPWAAYSFHLIEAITEGLIIFIIVFTLPIHPASLILFTLGGFLINLYGHLGYEIMPRWFRYSFLFHIINTSVYHNLHHHKFKGNYGLYFRFWDRLMKTENPDYVKEYDKIQEKRFDLKKAVKGCIMIPLLLMGFSSVAQIEGKWISKETNDVVEIYKENNFYSGKAISTKNKSENEIINSKNIMILQRFQKKMKTFIVVEAFFYPGER